MCYVQQFQVLALPFQTMHLNELSADFRCKKLCSCHCLLLRHCAANLCVLQLEQSPTDCFSFLSCQNLVFKPVFTWFSYLNWIKICRSMCHHYALKNVSCNMWDMCIKRKGNELNMYKESHTRLLHGIEENTQICNWPRPSKARQASEHIGQSDYVCINLSPAEVKAIQRL